jgi:rRNA maturation endonuclease Nob1
MPAPKQFDVRARPYHMMCDICGTKFRAKKSDARFCGPTCRQRAKRKRDKTRSKRKGSLLD